MVLQMTGTDLMYSPLTRYCHSEHVGFLSIPLSAASFEGVVTITGLY